MRKILCVGVFNPLLIHSASPRCGDDMFAKGFEANGFQVDRFDYRDTPNPNDVLVEQSRKTKYDFFYFGKCELITEDTIKTLREENILSIFMKFAADVHPTPTPHDISHLKYIDIFFATFAGSYLLEHRQVMPSRSIAMSVITFTDSDYYKKSRKDEKYSSDVLWTGRWGVGDNPVRQEIIKFLLMTNKYNVKLFGIENTPWVQDEYVKYISNTKIGVGANHSNRRMYTSDRLGNYMSCGTFYLAHYFEGIENVFKRGVHLDWFTSIEEMDEKIEYYLKHETERKRIARKGRERVLDYFDYKPLVKNILYCVEHQKSQFPWDEVY